MIYSVHDGAHSNSYPRDVTVAAPYQRPGVIEARQIAVQAAAPKPAQLSLGLVVVLTDEEREAIKSAIDCCEDITYGREADAKSASTLRGLLARCAIGSGESHE